MCVTCDLSHNAFDVTCILPPHQLRHINCAAAYIVWPRCMLGYIPPVDRITDTCKNITFPQLHLRAVINVCAHNWTAKRVIIASDGGRTRSRKAFLWFIIDTPKDVTAYGPCKQTNPCFSYYFCFFLLISSNTAPNIHPYALKLNQNQ